MEFKERYTPHIDEDIVAFANARGGTVLLDVRDDLLTQFNEAVAFLKKHLNVRSEIRGLNREDIYEIPLEVLREALINALMHRDYSITGTQVSVEVYDDRVEIINPGGLPKGLSIRDLGKISIRRNELIADLFCRLHKVERIGMGIRKMKDAMVAAGLREPTFEPDGFFQVIFHRSPEFAMKKGTPGIEEAAKKTGEKTRKKTGEKTRKKTGEKIIDLIRTNPEITAADLAEKIGITVTGIQWNINRLKEAGRLRRVGPDKGGYWEVVHQNEP